MLNIRKISLLGLLLSCSLTSLGSPICVASPAEAHRVLMTKNPFSESHSAAAPAASQPSQPSAHATTSAQQRSPAAQNDRAQTANINTVNINQADAAMLAQVLVGIGDKKAQAIIDYRNTHGGFTTIEQLDHVKGIGAATIEKNRTRIRLR